MCLPTMALLWLYPRSVHLNHSALPHGLNACLLCTIQINHSRLYNYKCVHTCTHSTKLKIVSIPLRIPTSRPCSCSTSSETFLRPLEKSTEMIRVSRPYFFSDNNNNNNTKRLCKWKGERERKREFTYFNCHVL